MTEYVTTNIRLPRAMHERIKRRAQEENKSFAQLVRESVTVYLTDARAAEMADWGIATDDPIYSLANLANANEVIERDRPTDSSIRHDYYLYGADLDEAAEVAADDE